MSRLVLSVQDLHVEFPTDDGIVKAVDGLSYDLSEGEVLGIVGESGSGKSVACLAILGLLTPTARVSGRITFRDTDLLTAQPDELRSLRGARISMIFQESLAALNPVQRVGDQLAEAITAHGPPLARAEVEERVRRLLDIVGTTDAALQATQYPHELSGGMRQRAMIAIAIAHDPDVLVADEPTTALDVTIQAQVLDVLERIQERTRSAIVLISHDLGVVAGMADRVLVMYAGKGVEIGPAGAVFDRPGHPYTRGLLASLPRVDATQRLYRIPGRPPSLIHPPPGCAFHVRCDLARTPDPCATGIPALRWVEPGHRAACHFAEEVPAWTPGAEPDRSR